MEQHIKALADTVKMCLASPDASVESFTRPMKHDLDLIWGWNHIIPPTYDSCMHDKISSRAQETPEKEAVSSWDGTLTYAQVDRYSSFVAGLLRDAGVKLNDFVPVCFEKSKWTIVAVLGVMKVGATLVLMDPTLPIARLQNMAKQTNANIVVTSRKQDELSLSIIEHGRGLVIDEDTFISTSEAQPLPELSAVPPSTLMYLIFTSGSTGTPKGVKISHQTYTSSAVPRAAAVGYAETSRVLDFASYAFDVSIDSMLLTLANGGCLCIPSDEERLSDINGAMRRMGVTYVGLTPSVARILDLDVIASLDALGLGGEAASARDITLWGQHTRIVIGYGPCECTIGCSVNSSAAKGTDYVTIGPGNGAALWLVDPNDHDSLQPVGAVGEILVEGPIVGQGYLNDLEKTAAVFIHDPKWLVGGHVGFEGRRGRLYKTGDLGRYDPAGSGEIVFVGRKDTQVKLRGQRIELEEIESHLKSKLPAETGVIAEVISPQGLSQPTLVVFIASRGGKGEGQEELELSQIPSNLREALSEANADLGNVLPRYMVPTTYIPVNYIPALISGKTNRKELRQFGATVNLQHLHQIDENASNRNVRPLNDIEKTLRSAWGSVLKIDPDVIGLDDNLLALGGDSLAAMRLVSVARAQGLELTFTSIFENPTLVAMASKVQLLTLDTSKELSAFSMVPRLPEECWVDAARACHVDRVDIEDIFPCTPTQESLFTFSHRRGEAYVAQRVARIPSNIHIDAWKRAWELTVTATPMLRIRLVQLRDPAPLQVVLKEGIKWKYPASLQEYLESDRKEKMEFGQSLARYAIINTADDSTRYMVWTIHHVLYDGWSEPLILENVSKALRNEPIEPPTYMAYFARYVQDTDKFVMNDYWRRELQGAVGPQFPRLPSRDFQPTAHTTVERQITLPQPGKELPFTSATVIRAAWALVASQYTGADDVVFGETLAGRNIALPGVEGIVGPLIATLPVRIRIDRGGTVEAYLQSVAGGILARTSYQHAGMQNIRKVSEDAQFACEAGTGLVIQPEPDYNGSDLGFEVGDVVREALHFNPYPLMLAFGIGRGSLRVCASFDSSIITAVQMERVLRQLEKACSQLTQDLSQRVGQITCLPDAELSQIWRWNQTAPLRLDEVSRTLRASPSTETGSTYPRSHVPWVCDARDSSLLSPIGCAGELWLEGASFLREQTTPPAWLLAGSSESPGRTGTVQPTGDIVLLRDDGALEFLGRKENTVSVNGHMLDMAGFEAQCRRHLPPSIYTVGVIYHSQQSQDVDLVVLVEHQGQDEDQVCILPEMRTIRACRDSSDTDGFEATICAIASTGVVTALQKLHKFLRDNFPSHMVPLAYIPIETIPSKSGKADHELISRLVENIPQELLYQIREGFEKAWQATAAQSTLSVPETILRSGWSKVLEIAETQISVDDNFFRLGGDSVLAMKLVASLRMEGHMLSVADIFRYMKLGDAAGVLKVGRVSQRRLEPPARFSLLDDLKTDVATFLSQAIYPKLADPQWTVQDVLPATDSQALDVKATIRAPRTSMQYTLLHFDSVLERQRLVEACRAWVTAHEILRTVFIEHDSDLLQVVLEQLEVPVISHRTNGSLEQSVDDICIASIESEMPLGSPFLKLWLVEDEQGKQCLIIGLSHAQYDGVSLPVLLRSLAAFYDRRGAVAAEPFSSYVGLTRNADVRGNAIKYWQHLLSGSSLSVLGDVSAKSGQKAIFRSKPVSLDRSAKDVTSATLLTMAWAVVLSRRLNTTDVTFGSITSGRNITSAHVGDVVGPCYQFTPVRVVFNPGQTLKQLLSSVQQQTAESSAHDFLGFKTISQNCPQWPSNASFFNSIVHHQDGEESDVMPWAGGSCKLEARKPHGDAALPVKAVSYVQNGQFYAGVVAGEHDSDFVDAVLDELADAFQELTAA